MEKNRSIVQAVEKQLKRIRRLEKSLQFITECQQNHKTPRFAKIGKIARRKLIKSNVSPNSIKKMERNNLFAEKKKHTKNLYNLQSEVNSNLEKLKNNCTNFENVKSKIMERVVKSEKKG